MNKKLIVFVGILVLVGIAVAMATSGFGSIVKNDDDTFTETKQVILTKNYPSLEKINKDINLCQIELSKTNALQSLYDKSSDDIEKMALYDAIIETAKCTNEQLTYLQDLENELSKVK